MYGFISTNSNFSILTQAIEATGLQDEMEMLDGATVFAPSNSAFEELALVLGITVDELLELELLENVLLYHFILDDAVLTSAIGSGGDWTTALGTYVTIDMDGTSYEVNGIPLALPDFEQSNGVLHFVNSVVLPEYSVFDVLTNPSLNYFRIALQSTGLSAGLLGIGPHTLFAPTDVAILGYLNENDMTIAQFLALPNLTEIMQYHVLAANNQNTASDLMDGMSFMTLSGENLSIAVDSEGTIHAGNGEVMNVDMMAQNGVVHTVDQLLFPPYNIFDALADGEFTLLTAALEATDLLDTVDGSGPLTLFAPNDSIVTAFLADQMITPADFLANPALSQILLYHVVGAEWMSADLTDGQMLESLNGSLLQVTVSGDSIMINDAMVISADIETDNGVLHVLNQVLSLPIPGCTDMEATNYNDAAEENDGSCCYLAMEVTVMDAVCTGQASGGLVVESTGGQGGVVYSVGELESTAGVFEELYAGTYTVNSLDSIGCMASVDVEIIEIYDLLEITASASGDDGTGNGVGTASGSGGLPPYEYSWYDIDGMIVKNPSMLAAGTYFAAVMDANGCRNTIQVVVEDVSGLGELSAMNLKLYPNPSQGTIQLTGLVSGRIDATVWNALGQSTWNQNSMLFNGAMTLPLDFLPSGMYFLQVRMNNGFETIAFEIQK